VSTLRRYLIPGPRLNSRKLCDTSIMPDLKPPYLIPGTWIHIATPHGPGFRRVLSTFNDWSTLAAGQRMELDNLVLCGLFRNALMQIERWGSDVVIQLEMELPDRDSGMLVPFVFQKTVAFDAFREQGPARCARQVLRRVAEHEVNESVALLSNNQLVRPFDPHLMRSDF
jgi:hypothetical protein